MSESGQEDGAWTFQAAREVTTDGATCGLHGYQNCGVCAARAARWLLRQHAAKDAELANRHAEIERLRGFVAELRRDSLHTDLVATLAEKNAELARLTAEVERAMAEAREAIRMADEDGGSSMTAPTPEAQATAIVRDWCGSPEDRPILVSMIADALTAQAQEIERLKVENAADRVRLGLVAEQIERATWAAAFKAACPRCDQGIPVTKILGTWEHPNCGLASCDASLLRARAAAQGGNNG